MSNPSRAPSRAPKSPPRRSQPTIQSDREAARDFSPSINVSNSQSQRSDDETLPRLSDVAKDESKNDENGSEGAALDNAASKPAKSANPSGESDRDAGDGKKYSTAQSGERPVQQREEEPMEVSSRGGEVGKSPTDRRNSPISDGERESAGTSTVAPVFKVSAPAVFSKPSATVSAFGADRPVLIGHVHPAAIGWPVQIIIGQSYVPLTAASSAAGLTRR